MNVTTATVSPALVMREVMQVLAEARQTQRESELAHSDTALSAAEDRAQHARDRAEAARHSALLQFSMNAGSALTSIGSSIGERLSTEQESAQRLNDLVNRDARALAEAGSAADDAFGFGSRASELDAEMENDTSRATLEGVFEERARLAREDLDEMLADARQVYRDLNTNGKEGA